MVVTKGASMNPAEFEANMAQLALSPDPHTAKEDAVDLMCTILVERGYSDGVRVFRAIGE